MCDDEPSEKTTNQNEPYFNKDLQNLQERIESERREEMVRQIESIPIEQTVIDFIRNNR